LIDTGLSSINRAILGVQYSQSGLSIICLWFISWSFSLRL